MWRRLKWTIAVLIASVGAAAHAEPGDRLPPHDIRPLRGPCDALESNWPCQPTPHTPYLRARALQEAFGSCAQFYYPAADGDGNKMRAYELCLKADPTRARKVFAYAATYFRDRDAQYWLGRLDLEGIGAPPNALQAARWLSLAAKNEQHQAQSLLGRILVNGEGVPRQAARGLMFLILARDGAPEDAAIGDLFDDAFKHASADEKAKALVLLEDWLKGQRN